MGEKNSENVPEYFWTPTTEHWISTEHLLESNKHVSIKMNQFTDTITTSF